MLKKIGRNGVGSKSGTRFANEVRDVNAFLSAVTLTGHYRAGQQKSLTAKLDREINSSSERFRLKVRAMHPSLKTYAA